MPQIQVNDYYNQYNFIYHRITGTVTVDSSNLKRQRYYVSGLNWMFLCSKSCRIYKYLKTKRHKLNSVLFLFYLKQQLLGSYPEDLTRYLSNVLQI